ncbi:hypothetical protein BJV74DRAFT_803494 [Russula compacta]|nr:hypothetical protein BJV74DRAFT_803494 [Russula compacta]
MTTSNGAVPRARQRAILQSCDTRNDIRVPITSIPALSASFLALFLSSTDLVSCLRTLSAVALLITLYQCRIVMGGFSIVEGFRPSNNSCDMSNPRYQYPFLWLDWRTPPASLACFAVIVPPQFARVKEILGIDGDLKRVFAPQGTIFSYDVNGKTRVKEECLIAVI